MNDSTIRTKGLRCVSCGAESNLVHILDEDGCYWGFSYCQPCLVAMVEEHKEELLRGEWCQ